MVMATGHFHVPGEATRREFAVYAVVARNRTAKVLRLYIGKTGDNREGCNPIISRLGNHFSFNKMHSQLRNHLPPPLDQYVFDVFYTTLGEYCDPKDSRYMVDLTNEMERRLNRLAQEAFGKDLIINPHMGIGYVSREETSRRAALVETKHEDQIRVLIENVREFLAN
jgi:hypothetical protein